MTIPLPQYPTPIKDHGFTLDGNEVGFLLIHGLSGTPVEMRAIADELHAQGYTVSCPQLAGHCGTYNDLKATKWQDWAQSADLALQDLSRKCSTIFVGGLSTGAILSLHLAATQPQLVSAAVLYAPTLWLNGWVVPFHAYLFNLVHTKFVANMFDFPDLPPHGIKDPKIRAKVHAAIQSGDSSIAGMPVTPGAAVLEHRWLVNSVRKRLKLIHQPILIIHPREDDYADLNNIMYLLRNLRSQVETLTLNDSYHIITTDRQKNVVIERTLQFMSQHLRTKYEHDDQPRQTPSKTRAVSSSDH
jgi:carboxylesterase